MELENLKDEQLVGLANEGNADAKEVLIVRYKPIVAVIASNYYLVGGDSDDLISGGLIGLIKAIKYYKPQDVSEFNSFKNFAKICISRQIYSTIRAYSSGKHEALNDSVSLFHFVKGEDGEGLQLWEVVASTDLTPEQALVENDRINIFLEKVAKTLSLQEKQVFDLMLEGYTYKDIAQKLSKTPKVIDNTIQRIRNKLR
ncbi:MAG: sigma-70 family RNA polymerase sigma factor [Firmicutes bacterium]|nr:sigma-70 family RNA polymerase sigma factor [Bacillota bacterium]